MRMTCSVLGLDRIGLDRRMHAWNGTERMDDSHKCITYYWCLLIKAYWVQISSCAERTFAFWDRYCTVFVNEWMDEERLQLLLRASKDDDGFRVLPHPHPIPIRPMFTSSSIHPSLTMISTLTGRQAGSHSHLLPVCGSIVLKTLLSPKWSTRGRQEQEGRDHSFT